MSPGTAPLTRGAPLCSRREEEKRDPGSAAPLFPWERGWGGTGRSRECGIQLGVVLTPSTSFLLLSSFSPSFPLLFSPFFSARSTPGN